MMPELNGTPATSRATLRCTILRQCCTVTQELSPGLSSIRQFYQAFWAAFPGSRLVFEDVFASGEKVACRFLLQGEHRGVFEGIAATGAHINLPGITLLEFHDGRCIRRWSYTDSAGLLQQLGVLPRR